ncbi:MAG: universal stress protein [Thiolinea sp.]
MYKSIIIPVDLSGDTSGSEMIEQARLVAAEGAQVHFVHVVEAVPVYLEAEIPSQLIVDSTDKSQQKLRDIATASGLQSTVHVRSGAPANEILEEARDREADLIIIKSHKPGFQDYFLGSTAARVVRHAKCSVLVMR